MPPMLKIFTVTLAIIASASPAAAQQSIKILTPTVDTCVAFTTAMDGNDQPQLIALSGWALGFLSGVAQGTGIDFLRKADAEAVMNRLYDDCHKQPTKPMSVALEEIAKALVANH